jgi:molybdenum cofactor cytidylyltransferase
MGQPKLLLPCGAATVLERVITVVRSAGIAEVVVVTAPNAHEVAQAARLAGAHVVQLAEETPDMRATCQFGLAWIEERFHPCDDDGWLLLPADHPTLRPEVIQALWQNADVRADASIFVPIFQGKRGHPTLFRWRHASGVRGIPADEGLNAYIRRHREAIVEVDWPSEEILWDLDTPADYERLLAGAHKKGEP